MKTIRLLLGLILVFSMSFAAFEAKAHKGHRGKHYVYTPYWVPTYAVRANMRHVYFPDYNIYFDRLNGTFVYLEGRRWVVSARVPACFGRVNFARAYKVGLDLNTSRPYVYNQAHYRDFRNRRSDHYSDRYYPKGNDHHHYKSDHFGRTEHNKDRRRTTNTNGTRRNERRN